MKKAPKASISRFVCRNSKVDIQDLDADTVHDMIIYIYSGKVGELEGKATGLLSAAEKYDLKVTFKQ